MKKKSCYIVTKPIQYVNATNIEDNNDKVCYITNTFSNAGKFALDMENRSKYWDKIFFVESKHKVLFNILRHKSEYSSIYLDSDMGILLRFLLVLLYPVDIYVYEEGLASYASALRQPEGKGINFYKFFIDFFFGKNWSGGSFRTKGIYLYHPEVFKSIVNTNKKKQILSFKQPLINHVNSLDDIKIYYSTEKIDSWRGKNILLYLTSWTINPEYEDIYNLYPDYIKVIKLHPHIDKNSISTNLHQFDYYPDSTMPAEILISLFIEIADTLVIIHEGSAAMLNFVSDKKIIEYNIASTSYKELYMNIKRNFISKSKI